MDKSTPARSASPAASVAIIGVLFFVFGFVTWLNGTLIPFLKLACDLQSDAQALLVTLAFYMAYFFLALPASAVLHWTGYKRGMALGLIVMAAGALVFVPAATTRSFGLFLTGLFVQGMGLALLQTASNPYVIVIGPIESAARRISIMGICNKVAGAVSPVILSAIVLRNASDVEAKIYAASDAVVRTQLLSELAERVIPPYVVMAAVLVILALLALFSGLPEIDVDTMESVPPTSASGSSRAKTSILQFPHLLLGVLCIFVYVGAEVMAGDVIGPYGKSLGMGLDQTKNFTSYTLWSMVVGYLLGVGLIPKYIRQETALAIMAVLGIAFSAAAWLTTGYMSVTCIALLGFANALMWPAIFPLAIDGLGRFTKTGSALLIMGIAGGALIPQAYAYLARGFAPQTAFFLIVAPCYLYVLFYAVVGRKAGR